jgi:hypothetical protein
MPQRNDYERARKVILDTIRREYLAMAERLKEEPHRERYIPIQSLHDALAHDAGLKAQWPRYDILFEVLWELLRQGLIRPHHYDDRGIGWGCWPTARGKEALCSEGSPEHPQFLEALVNLGLGQTAHLYLEEALECRASPTAMVMMAGVGTEAVMLELAQAYCNYLVSKSLQPKKLMACLQSKKTPVALKLKTFVEDVEGRWSGLETGYDAPIDSVQSPYRAIAQNRNEAGHPSGRRFEYDEAEAQLAMVRVHAKKGLEWMRWLRGS